MKNRLNVILLILWLVTAAACVVNWLTFLDLPAFILPVVPAFCSQLLLCRLTQKGWVRALPVLPVPALLAVAGWYAIFGSGWDMLAALIFGLAAIAPAVGVILGWLVWRLARQNTFSKEC